jgi:hypothetical protein
MNQQYDFSVIFTSLSKERKNELNDNIYYTIEMTKGIFEQQEIMKSFQTEESFYEQIGYTKS